MTTSFLFIKQSDKNVFYLKKKGRKSGKRGKRNEKIKLELKYLIMALLVLVLLSRNDRSSSHCSSSLSLSLLARVLMELRPRKTSFDSSVPRVQSHGTARHSTRAPVQTSSRLRTGGERATDCIVRPFEKEKKKKKKRIMDPYGIRRGSSSRLPHHCTRSSFYFNCFSLEDEKEVGGGGGDGCFSSSSSSRLTPHDRVE